MVKILGAILVFMGLIAIAGSGGDCDGKCMEYANTMTEMLMVVGVGLGMIAFGILFLMKE